MERAITYELDQDMNKKEYYSFANIYNATKIYMETVSLSLSLFLSLSLSPPLLLSLPSSPSPYFLRLSFHNWTVYLL
jgi:hypothetical protein